MLSRQGILCVVSGPSGSGKTTLCHRMAVSSDSIDYSVSCTTRAPREGEIHGADYHFLSTDDFRAKIADGELLEYAEVHGKDRFYGTLKAPVVEKLRRGIDVVMDLDVQGAEQLRQIDDPFIRASLVDLFILPPSVEELIQRVTGRGEMAEEELQRRMRNAEEEMQHWQKYQYTIVSGSREEDFARFENILAGERNRSSRLTVS